MKFYWLHFTMRPTRHFIQKYEKKSLKAFLWYRQNRQTVGTTVSQSNLCFKIGHTILTGHLFKGNWFFEESVHNEFEVHFKKILQTLLSSLITRGFLGLVLGPVFSLALHVILSHVTSVWFYYSYYFYFFTPYDLWSTCFATERQQAEKRHQQDGTCHHHCETAQRQVCGVGTGQSREEWALRGLILRVGWNGKNRLVSLMGICLKVPQTAEWICYLI